MIIDYVKMRLEDWGRWERSGNSLKFLSCKSWLGHAVDDVSGSKGIAINDTECWEVHQEYLKLKKFNNLASECIRLVFVKGLRQKDAEKELGIRKDKFRAFFKMGVGFMARGIS